MAQRRFTLDPASSKLLLHTRAEGLLARLAHDLELSCAALDGEATLDGDTWTAAVRAPVRALTVSGVLHGETLDRTVLSASDREQILTKMRDDVFGSATTVDAKASGARRDQGSATVSVGRASIRAPLTLAVTEREGGLTVKGSFEVSIKALGGKAIKGPLGAFSVKDSVRVRFELALVAAEG